MKKEIYFYRVEMIFQSGRLSEKIGNKFLEEINNVLAENDSYIVVDDFCFTSIKKKTDSAEQGLNKKRIYSHVNDRFWGTRIIYRLYADKKKKKSAIKRELSTYIKKEFAFLNGIDLSFLEG